MQYHATNGVTEIIIETWNNFFDLANSYFTNKPAFIFRGQGDYNWKVKSSIDRHASRYPYRRNLTGLVPEFFSVPPYEHCQHLRLFKHAMAGRRGTFPKDLTEDQWWALGQHHGLVTPLIDFTLSLYIALYFALEEETLNNGTHLITPEYRGVYALSTSIFESAPSSMAKLVPMSTDENSRQISQSGIFVKMAQGVDIEEYVKSNYSSNSHGAFFVKIRIPNSIRNECLLSLRQMNISRKNLFPDANGAASYANSAWQSGFEDLTAFLLENEN